MAGKWIDVITLSFPIWASYESDREVILARYSIPGKQRAVRTNGYGSRTFTIQRRV